MNSKNKLPKSIKIDKAKKICELYSMGQFTIATCCKAVGVEYNTFQGWAQPNLTKEDIINVKYRRGFVQVVHELYKKALADNETNYKALLKDTAREGILKRAMGITYVETHRETKIDKDGNSVGLVVHKVEKYIPPDTRILIFIANCLNLFFEVSDVTNLNSNLKNPFHFLADGDI